MVLTLVIVASVLSLAAGLGCLILRLKPDRVRVIATIAKVVHLELDIQATSTPEAHSRKTGPTSP